MGPASSVPCWVSIQHALSFGFTFIMCGDQPSRRHTTRAPEAEVWDCIALGKEGVCVGGDLEEGKGMGVHQSPAIEAMCVGGDVKGSAMSYIWAYSL